MGEVGDNIRTCFACPRRQEVGGKQVCGLDGGDVGAHAFSDCPDGRFTAAGPLATIAHGAVGLMKAAVGIDRAEEGVIKERRAVCGDCPHNAGRLMRGATCAGAAWRPRRR